MCQEKLTQRRSEVVSQPQLLPVGQNAPAGPALTTLLPELLFIPDLLGSKLCNTKHIIIYRFPSERCAALSKRGDFVALHKHTVGNKRV